MYEQPKLQETQPGGYKVESIILLASSFLREVEIDEKIMSSVTNELNVHPSAHETTPEDKFAVTLQLNYRGLQGDRQICSATIRMTGVFEKYGEPALSEDKFKAINAPAIIYPFIREHLHNLCLKAGIANVLLPTINFKP